MVRTPKSTIARKSYSVGLAGESNYQEAICVCNEGEPVRICHEIGNPYDEDALVVVSHRDETIGYIPRGNWLHDAIHEESRGCEAWIKSILGEREPMGVVIEVRLNDSELDSRDYKPASGSAVEGSEKGCLVALCMLPATALLASFVGG